MRRLATALLLISAAACGANSTTPVANVVGTYKLQSINGMALPFIVVDNATAKLEFLDDQVILTESGTYTQTGHRRTTEGGKVITATVVESGTYTRTGTDIIFRDGIDNTADYGTVDGSSLTVGHFGLLAKYAKQ